MATGKTIINVAEMDENGWAQIHYAALNGHLLSIEMFMEEDPELIEYATNDGKNSTPFLLAVSGGHKECIEYFIENDAKLNVENSFNQGAIEILLLNKNIDLLQFFIDKNYEDLPVWRKLFRFLLSHSEEEAANAAECLQMLTECNAETGMNPNWERLRNEGGIAALVRLLSETMTSEAKVPLIMSMFNMSACEKNTTEMVAKGLIMTLVKLLRCGCVEIVTAVTKLLNELAKTGIYAEKELDIGLVPILVKVMHEYDDTNIHRHIIQNFGQMAEKSERCQIKMATIPEFVTQIIDSFHDISTDLGSDLTNCLEKIVKDNPATQCIFINEGICANLILMLKAQNRDVQLSAVDAIYALANDNPETQGVILNEKLDLYLMQLFRKNRSEKIQERTANSLWAIAGKSIEVQRDIAMKMGVPLLIGFVKSMSENLHYIGSEGLGALAQDPISFRKQIAPRGTPSLVQLLCTPREDIVRSVMKTLRHLCVATGFVPNENNQWAISQTPGLRYLIVLMTNSTNPSIQVEAAVTLGYISLGNPDVLKSIKKNKDFTYSCIFTMLKDPDENIQLNAGLALSVYAYNNLIEQKEIADLGGIPFSWFRPFLESENEYFRCCSAFQVIILARIIPQADQVQTSATGIKIMIDLLQSSKNDTIISLVTDSVARLAHTRAGVPHGMISIDAVNYLCAHLLSPLERVRGNAAIALSYLAVYHTAERQLLHRCRKDPILMKVLTYYTKDRKLPTGFQDSWKYYQKFGLPGIDLNQLHLVNKQQNTTYQELNPPRTESSRTIDPHGSDEDITILSNNSVTLARDDLVNTVNKGNSAHGPSPFSCPDDQLSSSIGR